MAKLKVTDDKCRLFFEGNDPLVKPITPEINKLIAGKFGMQSFFQKEPLQIGIKFDASQNPIDNPQPGDYSFIPFRLISATHVGAGTWKSTDFSNENLLKKSIPLLSGRPAYLNHDWDVKNSIGTIGMCEWAPASGKPGVIGYMPAGIDGPYVIDRVLYPDLIRKLNAPMPQIQSSSVTVQFDWESSHEFENESDFWYHLGTKIDGEEVRRVVTNIKGYIESSLVFNGADPYAKIKKKDGSGYLNIPLSAEMLSGLGRFDANTDLGRLYQEEKMLFSIQSFDTSSYRKNYLNLKEDKMFNAIIAKAMGIPEAELTEERILSFKFVPSDRFEALSKVETEITSLKAVITEKETEVTGLNTKIESLNSSVTELQGKVTGLETTNATLQASAKVGDEFLASLKAETKASYEKLMFKKTVDPVMLKEIEDSSDVVSLSSKFKLFTGEAYSQFGAHCAKCGHTDIQLRQSESDGNDLKNKKGMIESHLEDLLD